MNHREDWNGEEPNNCQQTTKGENNRGKRQRFFSENTILKKKVLGVLRECSLIFNALAIKL